MSKDLVFDTPPRPASARRLEDLEKRIFAHEQVGELAPFCPETLILEFDDRFPKPQIENALTLLLQTHPAFTARFEHRPGGEVWRHGDARYPCHHCGHGSLADAQARSTRHQPTVMGTPVHVDLWHTAGGGHILALTLHPILADDAVFATIEAALCRALGADAIPAPPDEAPNHGQSGPQAQNLHAWQALLDASAIARVPHRAAPVDNGARLRATRILPRALSDHIRTQGTEDVLATALAVVLRRYSGLEAFRFVLGTPRPARHRQSGLMPLCVTPDPAQGFAQTLHHVAQSARNGRARMISAEQLVQDRLGRQDADRNPLGAVALHIMAERELPHGITRHMRPTPPLAEEVVVMAQHTHDGLHLTGDAEKGLYAQAQIERLLCHLERVITAGLERPDHPTARIEIVSTDELDALSAPYPDNVPVDPRATHEIIADHARATPDKLAVICGADRLTHGALDAQANALAHRLVALGVGAEVPVAIVIERGAAAMIAILAAMKAGGAYVPVEPDHPESRNHHILNDAGVRVVLTRKRYQNRLPAQMSATVLCLDDITDPPRGDAPQVTIHPDQMAYIMYTSGSTGKPKGVAVEHGPLSDHNQTTARVYEMSSESRELPFLPFSSDGGHERWMVPLMVGGSVVIPDGPLWTPEQTLAAMREHGCNNASIPTTYLQQLAEWAEDTRSAPPMRLYSFGGEGLAQSTFDLLSRALKAKTLINGYGPTETIMTPMVWKVAAGTQFEGVYAPLGRAVGDRRAYVLDPEMMPCPQGIVGEIYLGGTGVARGYVGKPDVTADRFIPDPFGPLLDATCGARLYRTGDLGRWREDGTIEFVGRVDLQIKVNGYRIEPGEIEAALLAEPLVSEALVLLREDGAAKRLLAYVTGPDLANGPDLLRALETKLPRHMLPEAVIVLDRMPTNANAKLDRAALPMMPAARAQGAGVTAKGPTEEKILALWREIIGVPDMGVTDDFFAMGGKSLLALKALAGMRKYWPDTALTIADLFDAPTVRTIAARIEAGGQTGRTAIALRATGTKPRLYCFPGLLVSTREYMRLTDYLGPDQPVTGFLCHSLNEEKTLNVSVEDVVAEYVAHIRAQSAGEPVALLGWSWGGLLAWEAARQLRDTVDIRLLGMVDVCDLGTDFMPGVTPQFAAGERAKLERDLQLWLGKTRMRPQWDRLIGSMDAECYAQFLRFIGNERDSLPFDGPEISSREHTFWVLIDNALVFRRHRPAPLDLPVASFSAGDSLSRGLNLMDWRKLSPRAAPAEVVAGTNHLHIIGEARFHARFKARLETAWES
ncbi:amino acid adenylation domain-containing protein [Rhodobacteraceae bacterium]|nr:amino acid adenylation domain-containing protein [Paracoccaceae bacterium]